MKEANAKLIAEALDNTFELLHEVDLLRIEVDELKQAAHSQTSRLLEASLAYNDNLKSLAKMIGGWEDSVGIKDELKLAEQIGKLVSSMNPQELFEDE